MGGKAERLSFTVFWGQGVFSFIDGDYILQVILLAVSPEPNMGLGWSVPCHLRSSIGP